MAKMTPTDITGKHPRWTVGNILYLSRRADDELEFALAEAMLELPCVKCRIEMGEHRFVDGKFQCPSK